jgi:carboxyl-terminal processing protease
VLVVLCCGATIGGIVRRNQVDVGASNVVVGIQDQWDNWLASKDNEAPGRQVSEDSFFAELSGLLKKEYVDPIEDDTKLATGAVRGMVASLGNVNTFFMDDKEFAVYKDAMHGKLQGIGADFALHQENRTVKALKSTPGGEEEAAPAEDQDSRSVPVLVVTAVAPDGPAAKAGIKPGDWVENVAGHPVVNPKLVRDLAAIRKQAAGATLTSSQIFDLNQKFREKAKNSILPWRAKDKLMIGDSGTLRVSFNRNGSTFTRDLQKATAALPALTTQADGSLLLRLQPGVSEQLKTAISGKSSVVLDLRGGGTGSFSEMKKCLAVLAPNGSYGKLTTQRKGAKATSLTVQNGNKTAPKMTFLVDRWTRGPAEILALALSSRGLATLKGEKTAGVREVVDVVALPDGSGYTLTTSVYEAAGGTK